MRDQRSSNAGCAYLVLLGALGMILGFVVVWIFG